jgi:hypothetical protein
MTLERGAERARRDREMTIIYAVMTCLLFLLIVQLLMLMVSIEAFMAGRTHVALPGALASGACCAGACWLIRFVTSGRRLGPAARS